MRVMSIMLYPPSQQMRKILHSSKFALLPLGAKNGSTQPHYNTAEELLGKTLFRPSMDRKWRPNTLCVYSLLLLLVASPHDTAIWCNIPATLLIAMYIALFYDASSQRMDIYS